jgi:hypothetical protein
MEKLRKFEELELDTFVPLIKEKIQSGILPRQKLDDLMHILSSEFKEDQDTCQLSEP